MYNLNQFEVKVFLNHCCRLYIIVETSFEDVVVVLESMCEVLADEVPGDESVS